MRAASISGTSRPRRVLAEHTWLRHFDDRLGLSHEELKRFESMPVLPLPACEPLLADKPCHLFERPPNKALDAKYGGSLSRAIRRKDFQGGRDEALLLFATAIAGLVATRRSRAA